MVTFWLDTPVRALWTLFAAFVFLCPSVSLAAGTDVCVSMSSNGQVAGVQMGFAWDASCMSAKLRSGNVANCTPEPATGKDVHSSVTGSRMTVLFFSLSDTTPIPDGNLFCCAFTSSAPPSNPCCSLSTMGVHLSDSAGQARGDADAVLQASVGGVPCTTASVSGSGGSTGGALPPPPGYNAAQPAAPPPAVQIPAPGAPQGGAPAGSLGQAPPPGGNTEPAEPAVEVSGQATATPPQRVTAPQRTATAPVSPTVRPPTPQARSTTATAPTHTATPGGPTPTSTPRKVK
jgi:hypothetical protein